MSPEAKDEAEQEAKHLEEKFGELAPVYAENRSEAAELRGASKDAELWQEVKDEIEGDEHE